MEILEQTGEDGIAKFVTAFYGRMKKDDLVGPMYTADDWDGSEQRLRDFLIFRFGGSQKSVAFPENSHPERIRQNSVVCLPFNIRAHRSELW